MSDRLAKSQPALIAAAAGFITALLERRASGVRARLHERSGTTVILDLHPRNLAMPPMLLRCDCGPAGEVGVKPLRRLHSETELREFRLGVFITRGNFLPGALEFAAGRDLELLDGIAMLDRL